MKIRSVGVELFRPGRRTDIDTDMTKLVLDFHNFAKAAMNGRRNDVLR